MKIESKRLISHQIFVDEREVGQLVPFRRALWIFVGITDSGEPNKTLFRLRVHLKEKYQHHSWSGSGSAAVASVSGEIKRWLKDNKKGGE